MTILFYILDCAGKYVIFTIIFLDTLLEKVMSPVADLRGREGRTPPWGSKFFQFHAIFWEN